MKFSIIFLSITIFIFSSCDKVNPEDFTKEQLLAVVWKVSEVKIDGTVDSSKDYSTSTIEFKPDKTYAFNIAGTSTSGTWTVDTSFQSLILDKDETNEQEVMILSLGLNKLELEFTEAATTKDAEKKIVFNLTR